MKTVGEILRETREQKGLEFSEIEKATKIRKKYLQFIEDNDFSKIGPAFIVKGFIKNYGEYLHLSSTHLLAVFRRDFTEDKVGQVILRGMVEPLDQVKIRWNPRLTAIALFVLGIVFLAAFLGWHIWTLQSSG